VLDSTIVADETRSWNWKTLPSKLQVSEKIWNRIVELAARSPGLNALGCALGHSGEVCGDGEWKY
jgi:hypothetical protein